MVRQDAALALLGTLLPPVMFFADVLDLSTAQQWMLVATILRSIATPFWMKHRAT